MTTSDLANVAIAKVEARRWGASGPQKLEASFTSDATDVLSEQSAMSSSPAATTSPATTSFEMNLFDGIAFHLQGLANSGGLGMWAPLTMFDAAAPPAMPVREYMVRLGMALKCDERCFVLAALYIARTGLQVTLRNVHRLVLTALLLSLKWSEDRVRPSSFHAAAGGVTREEVNACEITMLQLLDWRVVVTESQFDAAVAHFRQQLCPPAEAQLLVMPTPFVYDYSACSSGCSSPAHSAPSPMMHDCRVSSWFTPPQQQQQPEPGARRGSMIRSESAPGPAAPQRFQRRRRGGGADRIRLTSGQW